MKRQHDLVGIKADAYRTPVVKTLYPRPQTLSQADAYRTPVVIESKLPGDLILACGAEIHIRIALERGELGDFSKCLSPLLALYQEAVVQEGTAQVWSENANEFIAYR